MTTINIESLNDVAVVIGTAFPVLAVAYYSAARGMLDDKLQTEGPEWNVDLLTPPWTHKRFWRRMIQWFGRVRFRDGEPDFFPLNERFKLSTDRFFVFAMPVGLMLTLAYLLFSWRWALAVGIVLLQVTIDTLILFGTQVSMIRLASAIAADRQRRQPGPQPPQPAGSSGAAAGPFDTRPMAALIRAFVMSLLLTGAAIAVAIVVELATVRRT